MEKNPASKALIRFQDCDPLGHLNNSQYLEYMINAREDHLREYYDLDIYAYLDRTRVGWVVAKNEILYRNPALLNEKVILKSQVSAFDERKIFVEIGMYDEKESHLKALLWTVFIPFDVMSNSVSKHDDQIMELLRNVVQEIPEKSIEERADSIKTSLKTSI